MQRLKIENADITKVAIQQEIARSEDSRYDHRLHGVLLVCQGYSCPEVSEILGDSPRIIEYREKNFNDNGFESLHEEKRSGRPSVIDGKMLSHHLKEKYDINLGVRQSQRIFNKLDFRLRKPRPVIAKSDDEAKAEFKKNFKVKV